MAKGNRTHKEASDIAKRMMHGIVTGARGKSKAQKLSECTELSPFYTRPLYYGTSLQNDTIAELHKDDYKKKKAKWERV